MLAPELGAAWAWLGIGARASRAARRMEVRYRMVTLLGRLGRDFDHPEAIYCTPRPYRVISFPRKLQAFYDKELYP